MIDDTSMNVKFNNFAKRDGPKERRSDGATDTAAIDASKNVIWRVCYYDPEQALRRIRRRSFEEIVG